MAREVQRRGALALYAIGAALVLMGQALPYAILPSGGVAMVTPVQLLLLGLAGFALFLASRQRLAWLAVALAVAVVAAAGYSAMAMIRAVPTWSAVNYEADGAPGPATYVMTAGLLVAAVAIFVRVLFPAERARL
jgi:hypothetical protein